MPTSVPQGYGDALRPNEEVSRHPAFRFQHSLGDYPFPDSHNVETCVKTVRSEEWFKVLHILLQLMSSIGVTISVSTKFSTYL